MKNTSLVMQIFEDLWNTHLYYKGVKVNLLGVSVLWDNKKYPSRISFGETLYRFKKKGYIEAKNNKLFLTKKR